MHDAPPDYEYRNKLRLLAQKEGPIRLHRILQKVDPQAAVCIHSNDIKRIIRALEYYKQTGRPISERLRQETKPKYEYRIIGLKWQRGDLYMRIDDRVKEQFRRGIIEETQGLLEMGYLPEHPGLQGLVYKETCQYLYGLVSLQECKE